VPRANSVCGTVICGTKRFKNIFENLNFFLFTGRHFFVTITKRPLPFEYDRGRVFSIYENTRKPDFLSESSSNLLQLS